MKVARMSRELRQQMQVDALCAQMPVEQVPLCAWEGCTHRAVHRHPPGSVPAFECWPHNVHGQLYESVRPQASVVLAALQAGAGAVMSAPRAAQPGAKAMGKRMLLDGLRTLADVFTRPRKGPTP